MLVALTSLAITGSAQATPQTFYFGCAGTDRVQNGSGGASGAWTSTAPTANLADGGGCAVIGHWRDDPVDAGSDAQFGGSYSGDVKRIEFTLFDVRGIDANLGGRTIFAHVLVGGEDVTDELELTSPITAAADGQTAKTTFTIDDLSIPATTDPRTIVLVVSTKYFVNDHTAWLLGAKDYPASVTFSSHEDLPDPPEEEV
jgi:hypothetical protein